MLTLEEQDRSLWDAAAIAEGTALLRGIVCADRYTLQAAIAAMHANAPSWEQTDWRAITAMYNKLLRLWPTPVVYLNHAVAAGLADGPARGLALLDALAGEPALAAYGYFEASRAHFLNELGRTAEAYDAYEAALLLTENEVERQFLVAKLESLGA